MTITIVIVMNFITSSSCGRRRCCRRHRHSRGRSLSLSRRRSSSSSSSRSGKSIGGSRSSGSRSSSSSSSISSGMDMYEVFATTRIFAAAQAQNNAILGSNNVASAIHGLSLSSEGFLRQPAEVSHLRPGAEWQAPPGYKGQENPPP